MITNEDKLVFLPEIITIKAMSGSMIKKIDFVDCNLKRILILSWVEMRKILLKVLSGKYQTI